MSHFIDIHTHILPCLDDGAEDLETSVAMLRAAKKEGTVGVILTPHWGRDGRAERTDFRCVETLRSRLAQERIFVELYLGNELYYHSGLGEELQEEKARTLAGSRYVLVEFAPMEEAQRVRGGIYALQTAGYFPVLAHAERYRKLDGNDVYELAEMGCYIQVNAGGIMGRWGSLEKRKARGLLKSGLVHFVASDAHDLGKRAPGLQRCAGYVAGKYGEDCAKRLFYDNPMCVVADEIIR